MRKNLYFINILHILVVASSCLGGILIKSFLPDMVLVRVSIPLLVLLSLIPMVVETYMVSGIKRNGLLNVLIAGITFTVLPLCVGGNSDVSYATLFVAGTAVFGITDILYRSMAERMASGLEGKFVPVINGIMLFLASQCFQGLL